jgi:N-methylhydantoinase B
LPTFYDNVDLEFAVEGSMETLTTEKQIDPHFQNTQNAPVEETELNYPVRIPRYCLVPDSDGPGRTRGGLGICREYAFVDHDVVFTTLADRAKFPAHGLFGGESGRCARYLLLSGETSSQMPSKGTIQVKAGQTVRIESPGGGGYGPPAERNPELVIRDVREGKVSERRAQGCYGLPSSCIPGTFYQAVITAGH